MVNSFLDHGKWEFDTRYLIFEIREKGISKLNADGTDSTD